MTQVSEWHSGEHYFIIYADDKPKALYEWVKSDVVVNEIVQHNALTLKRFVAKIEDVEVVHKLFNNGTMRYWYIDKWRLCR